MISARLIESLLTGMMLGMIIALAVSCCIHKKQNFNDIHVKSITKSLEQNSNYPVESNNFVIMETYVMSDSEGNVCESNDDVAECIEPLHGATTASGYVIKKDTKNNLLYILTAAHWCTGVDFNGTYVTSDDVAIDNHI